MSKGWKFPGQKEGEEIQVLVRKHWIIALKISSIFIVFGVLPLAGIMFFVLFGLKPEVNENLLAGLIGFLLYFMILLLFVYLRWLNEELDMVIITNERILCYDQVSLFYRRISETNISQVQDVLGVERGFLGHMLKYGTLRVQTAAHNNIVFEIRNISNPYAKARAILDLHAKYLDKKRTEFKPAQ